MAIFALKSIFIVVKNQNIEKFSIKDTFGHLDTYTQETSFKALQFETKSNLFSALFSSVFNFWKFFMHKSWFQMTQVENSNFHI